MRLDWKLMTPAHPLRAAVLCASLLLATGSARADEQTDALGKLLTGTWRVEIANKLKGTAFLVSNDGYFISATHVVAVSNDANGPKFSSDIKLSPDDGAPQVSATVTRNWCLDLDITRRMCRKGFDAVLLKTSTIGKEFVPFDIGFVAATPKHFQATYTGYANRLAGAAAGTAFFKLTDATSLTVYEHFFADRPTNVYQTLSATFPGNSGGPIAYYTPRGYEVVGILSWRWNNPVDEEASSAPTYGATINALRTIWSNVPKNNSIKKLADEIQSGSISAPALSAALGNQSNTGIVSLISELQERESKGGAASRVSEPHWTALYDAATVRELDWDKPFLEQRVDISRNISWVRESAKTRRRLGEYNALSGNAAASSIYFNDAIALNQRFLKAARLAPGSWYGPKVFSAVVAEMSLLHANLGETRNAVGWATLGAQAGSVNSTETLAKYAVSQEDFEASANLYALAWQQATAKGRPVPDHLTRSYQFARQRLQAQGETPGAELPGNIRNAPAKTPNALLGEAAWIDPAWKELQTQYAPDFAVRR